MIYKASVWQNIGENTVLRLKIALALGVTENAIVYGVRRKSKTLMDIRAVNVIKEELSLTEEELFEPVNAHE